MSQPIATLFALVGTLAASSALAQNSVVGACPPGMSQQCVWTECQRVGNAVQCAKYAPLSAPAPVVTPPAVFAPPVAMIGPANAPSQQVNACVAGNCGGSSWAIGPCGIPWCLWGLLVLVGFGVLYLIVSRIKRGPLVGELRGHLAHWNLLHDKDGNPLPGVSLAVLIELARAIETTRGEINENDFLRGLRLSANGRTAMDGNLTPRGYPTVPGIAGAAGTTP